MALSEREEYFQSQLKSYEIERDHAVQTSEELQSALSQMQTESITHENQLSQTIDAWKQNVAELQNEFQDRGLFIVRRFFFARASVNDEDTLKRSYYLIDTTAANRSSSCSFHFLISPPDEKKAILFQQGHTHSIVYPRTNSEHGAQPAAIGI